MRNSKSDIKCYIWNTIAGLINASEAVIILTVLTRTNGLADAGIVTMGFSVANLFVTVGKFGVRNLQVTDVRERYAFVTYLRLRAATTLSMLAGVCAYLACCIFFKGYSLYKSGVIFLICCIYVFESVEDVFWGRYQQMGRLDLGAKIFSLRWCLTIGTFVSLAVATGDLTLTAGGACAVSVAAGSVLIHRTRGPFMQGRGGDDRKATMGLLRQSLPLFLASFSSFYILNAPKYAIDAYLPEEVQACYGFVSMPVFAIGLLSGFVYQPSLVRMSVEWREGRYGPFVRGVARQVLTILAITAACIAGARLCGIPVLSRLYGTDLGPYRTELLTMLLGGGMLALVGYDTVIITILRRQADLCWGYLAVSAVALVVTGPCVRRKGAMGAAGAYLFLVSVLACVFSLSVVWRIRGEIMRERRGVV